MGAILYYCCLLLLLIWISFELLVNQKPRLIFLTIVGVDDHWWPWSEKSAKFHNYDDGHWALLFDHIFAVLLPTQKIEKLSKSDSVSNDNNNHHDPWAFFWILLSSSSLFDHPICLFVCWCNNKIIEFFTFT